MAVEISSDRFIELFITLKQLRHYSRNKEINLYNANWSFSVTDLKEFILYSKKDYRYKEFLSCFNFEYIDNIPYSINLICSLNRAMSKHLITGIYDDKVYLSRHYINRRILEDNNEYYNLMNEFIESFEYFCLDKSLYLRNLTDYLAINDGENNSRMIFDLQRRIVKSYEDKA